MRAAHFLGTKQEPRFQIREAAYPSITPDEVCIKVHACGICGTDVHIYLGEEGSAPVNPPIVLGHEFAGVVVDKGAHVKNLSVGDHVAVDPNIYCGICRPCRTGKKQNCRNLYAYGVNANGGFAEYAAVPAKQCFRIRPEIDLDFAAMAEPLACAIHGIDRIGIRPGQSVLIIGGGTIGLLMLQLALLSGASKTAVSEPIEMRRRVAETLGAGRTFDPTAPDILEEVRDYFDGSGADAVIECVGRTSAVSQAISCAGPGGRILLFSVPEPAATIPLPLFDVYKKELSILGSIINPDTHQRAVDLINEERISLRQLITHVYGLEELESAIHMQMSSQSIKVLCHPFD